jgi:tRNA-dihydrouridine synthase C
MLNPNAPALVLAPMDGITDASMRALQGATGAFTYAVSEFLRVSVSALPIKMFQRDVPEVVHGSRTVTGMPVQVQLLGGDPERMAQSAYAAYRAGAKGIDINFGCPAPTVNRNDGGATLLRFPCRVREVVAAVRGAVPPEIPVSAKLRLGWDSIDAIDENAAMAAEGGASWLTIHARTRLQGYQPPVYWPAIGRVREALGLPIVANGDIWTIDDFHRCQAETGCIHFMIGRGALADPRLPYQIAHALGLPAPEVPETDWPQLFESYVATMAAHEERFSDKSVVRLKQWMKLAYRHGEFPYFHDLKETRTLAEFFTRLGDAMSSVPDSPLART